MSKHDLSKQQARDLLLDHHLQYALSQYAHAPAPAATRGPVWWLRWIVCR